MRMYRLIYMCACSCTLSSAASLLWLCAEQGGRVKVLNVPIPQQAAARNRPCMHLYAYVCMYLYMYTYTQMYV